MNGIVTTQDKVQFERSGEGLIVNAPCKINLYLLIEGKREDGFHEIDTLMSKINWYDQIHVEHGHRDGIEMVCQGAEWAPEDESNLVYKAARLVSERTGFDSPVKLTLTKNIPAGTGLGSASSDAASTLIGLNEFFELGINEAELMDMGSVLGSDIPFFIGPQLSFCRGRGEKIEKYEKNTDFHAILLVPNISSSTIGVYKNYQHDSALYSRLSGQIKPLIEKKRVDLAASLCANMLQTSCFELHEALAELASSVTSLGIGKVCLSGSGSAMFILLEENQLSEASNYQREILDRLGCPSVLVHNNRW